VSVPSSTADAESATASGPADLRVVLAEDNALLRQGLCQLIDLADGVLLAGAAADMPSLLALVAAERPDVVVTDIRMPPTHTDEGIRIAARLRSDLPSCGVVVLSQYAEARYALALLEGGSAGRGYLLKERVGDVGELTAAIRQVAGGGSVIDPTVVEGLVAANRGGRSVVDTLTPRERDVLGEMAQGKSNAAIAASLSMSERAVEKHTNSIFGKFGLSEERDLNRRVSAVLLYLERAGTR
jgi:DNA-binding NarL/FixJ family response regulator